MKKIDMKKHYQYSVGAIQIYNSKRVVMYVYFDKDREDMIRDLAEKMGLSVQKMIISLLDEELEKRGY